jgi:hypothetical protein
LAGVALFASLFCVSISLAVWFFWKNKKLKKLVALYNGELGHHQCANCASDDEDEEEKETSMGSSLDGPQ